MAHVNIVTGEVLDLAAMTDEEIVEQLKDLEQAAWATKVTLDAAKLELQRRMENDGAKLRLTPSAKLRLHKRTRIRDRKLVEQLHRECPDALKDRCFRFDIRPLKTGLNELAKLGDDWRRKVDAIYEESHALKVEWVEENEQQVEDSQPAGNTADDVPF